MIPKSTDVFCGDLADNQLFYRDSYTFYQASPSLELTQDTFGCLPMSSTPNRAQRSTQSLWPSIPAYWDTYPITTSPRALVTPSTSSISTANMQLVFSLSPLPLSQVPSLVYPDISPPSQGSGSTPFERQFVGDFPREWNSVNTQISPVARRNPHSSFLSPTFSNAGGTPSRAVYGSTSQDFQDAAGRVSLIDKFISAAADESATSKNDTPLLTFTSQNRCSSPLSNLSELTPLSSPESSDRFGRGFDLRSSSPPTSPTVEGPKDPRESSIQYTPNSEREPSPSQSTRSLSRDSDYQPAKGTAGYKRKRASRSRDGDETPIKRRKIRTTSVPETPSADTNPSFEILTRRRLPTNIPFHAQFPLFYLRFPVSSYLRLADGIFPLLSADSKRVPGTYNEPRDGLDLYTPRFVKGCGATKVGVCPICIESPSRGGKGEVVWLSMKFSAYKVVFLLVKILNYNGSSYHLQYAHGISSISARPFSPPVAFRTIERRNPAKNERATIQEGRCHKCNKWIPVQSIKDMDIKVKELYWWKHAAACHQGNNMEGDDDFFHDDEIYRRTQQSPDRDP